MAPQLLQERPAAARGGGPGLPGPGGSGGGGGRPAQEAALPTGLVGVGAFLAAVTMLFVAFTSAYLARRQEPGWPAIAVPWVLWVNTALLLASSGTLEWARGRLRRGDVPGLRRGLGYTAELGILFVLGQLIAWRQLADQGIYLTSNPHSSFFYMLTGAHGLHLLGGLGALAVVSLRAWQGRYTAQERTGVSAFALYWHFMDALWLYLFALLFWA